MRILTSLLILGACAADPIDDGPETVGGDGKADGVELNVNSPNARPGARYMKKRSAATLHQLLALTPVMKTILQRMVGYGQSDFGVSALLYVEVPSRYATFLPAERAAFPDLWKLLEIDDAIDLSAASEFPELASTVQIRRPQQPTTLDTSLRVGIPSLPAELQVLAHRVIKPTTAPPDTISYAEVVAAVAAPEQYIPSEYFYFGPLLRAIERARSTPATFPHLDVLAPLDKTTHQALGQGDITIERETHSHCDDRGLFGYRPALISAQVEVRLTIPTGTRLTWIPITSTGEQEFLTPSGTSSRSVYRPAFAGDGPPPRSLALVELWQNGQRTAQELVILPWSEFIDGDGLAIREGASFTCMPFGDVNVDRYTEDPSNVLRLPPGRYPVPAGSYGTATLNIYGVGVMRLDVGQKAFWAVHLPSTANVLNACWTLTQLTSSGAVNLVTEAPGAGPGFRLNFQTGSVFFDEVSSAVCNLGPQSGGGSLVTTLSEASRL